jgi:hypothetical protein
MTNDPQPAFEIGPPAPAFELVPAIPAAPEAPKQTHWQDQIRHDNGQFGERRK